MIVKDLVETRELLTDETEENVFVVYERFDNVDCLCKGSFVEQLECDPEEIVQVLIGNPEGTSSLKSVSTYKVGELFGSVDAIIEDIRKNHTELLIAERVLQPLG